MKVIVSHPGKQHSFQLAEALQKKNILYKYITSVYTKSHSFTGLLAKISKGDLKKKLSTRYCSSIPTKKVKQFKEFNVIVTLFLNRLPYIQRFTEWWNFITESGFYKKVMKFARKESVDAVIYYNGYANKHLNILAGRNIVKIMDVSIGHRLSLQRILDKEIKESGIDKIRKEHLSYWNSKMIMNDLEGCSQTDYFLAASDFVKQSLIENGIKEEQIKLVPYGVNISQFTPLQDKKLLKHSETLRLLYVGSISYRKGIHRLLHVVSKMKGVEINLAGSFNPESEIYAFYKDFDNINFHGFVTRDRLNILYNQSHVFVLPSFCEGMAMVGLEAMSAGLPIICTTNTGVNDVVVDGENGFVYPPNDECSLKNHIEWFLKNPDKLQYMSAAARTTSLRYSWEIYHENVAKAIIECVEEFRKK